MIYTIINKIFSEENFTEMMGYCDSTETALARLNEAAKKDVSYRGHFQLFFFDNQKQAQEAFDWGLPDEADEEWIYGEKI